MLSFTIIIATSSYIHFILFFFWENRIYLYLAGREKIEKLISKKGEKKSCRLYNFSWNLKRGRESEREGKKGGQMGTDKWDIDWMRVYSAFFFCHQWLRIFIFIKKNIFFSLILSLQFFSSFSTKNWYCYTHYGFIGVS